MADRKTQSKKRYLLAFLIGTFIFINVFFLTYSISYFEYQRISGQQEQLSYKIFKDEIYYSLFDKTNCSLDSFQKISENLRFQGAIIDALEKKFGKNDEKVLFRKKFYSLVELKHFEFVREMNNKCKFNILTILFFYSNRNEDVENSEQVGKLLDSVYIRNSNVVTYSFDINLDDELIAGLKKEYLIEKSATIVINEKINIVNPENIEEIEKYLK